MSLELVGLTVMETHLMASVFDIFNPLIRRNKGIDTN